MFELDGRQNVPIYEQVVRRVKELCLRGVLRPGDKLPSVRELSAQIVANPNTVAKAYQELEREGVIETRPGRGTFVADPPRPARPPDPRRGAELKERLRQLVIDAAFAGAGRDELEAWLDEVLDELERRVLEVSQLCKRIDGIPILTDLSFTAAPGTVTGLVGRNGTGKTTLLRTIAGIYAPDGGEVRFAGEDLHAEPAARRHLFLVADSRDLLQHETPEQIGRLFRLLYPSFDTDAFTAWLARFDLPPRRRVRLFSRGMKALFYIALAFATRAGLLLLDEPTEGLDPIYKRESLRLIVEEVAAHRTAVLISSHRLEELQSICDRVLFLKEGRIDGITDVATMRDRYGKWQVAFGGDDGEAFLATLPSVRILRRSGRVFTLLVEEGEAELADRLRAAGAVLVEPLPLQLEDLFIERLGGETRAGGLR